MSVSDRAVPKPSPTKSGDGVLIGLAATAALAAGLLAVAQHSDCTEIGYQLAVAERERLELRRDVARWERRVAELSTAAAATARQPAMKLASLKYPKTWNVVSAATVKSCAQLLPATPAAPPAPTPTKGTPR